jgi:CBS domain-containing protein
LIFLKDIALALPSPRCAQVAEQEVGMKVRDVMVAPVITVKPSATVRDVAGIFVKRGISAVPVVDDEDRVVGIVSEGDLLHRAEAGTERRRTWWLRALTAGETLAADYVKAHARKVADIMTRDVVTVSPDAPLHEVAALMEKNSIKRVPVLSNGQLVGIISRANLVQAVASAREGLEVPLSDTHIRNQLLAHLNEQPWAHTGLLNITVTDGVVDLWGMTTSKPERAAIRVAAESVPGVRAVNDNLTAWQNLGGV